MELYLLSDNVDTQVGMRLVGIDGSIVHCKEELHQEMESVFCNENIAIVLITTIALNYDVEYIYDLKLNRTHPLIVEIPDRHNSVDIGEVINQYISEAIGMKI